MKYGYSINHIEENGYSWMLLYWKIKILKRPHWNTELTVKTWPRKFEKVSSWRDFEVFDKNGELVSMGTSEWVLIDTRKQSISKISEKMAEEYGLIEKSVFEEKLSRKVKCSKRYEKGL